MLNNIAETRIPITLDKEYILYFNANTMCAFEEATSKNFLATVASLYEAYKPILDAQKAGKAPDASNSAFSIVQHVPMKELTALIWAGLHTYDNNDNPIWPLTLQQVRRLVTLESIPRLFLSFLQGQSANSPTEKEMGESPAPSEPPAKVNGLDTAPKSGTAGGGPSIELPEGAFT